MINLKFSSKRIGQFTAPIKNTPVHSPSPLISTMYHEAQRRDKIIRKLQEECPYKEGDKVRARGKFFDTYGDNIEVEQIMSSYSQFGRGEKWPENDQPLIVTAYSPKTGERFHCTTNLLEKM